jgi:alpha-glucosidase
MLLLTLRGTPTTYYGEEIGMENVPIPPEFIQDPPAVNQPEIAHIVGRDPERTPMQWDNSANAGFAPAGVTPWLPVASDSTQRNVARQDGDPKSMLSLYRTLAELRRSEPALHAGLYASVDVGERDAFAYTRNHSDGATFLVVLNFGATPHTLNLSQVAPAAEIAVATGLDRAGAVNLARLELGPNEGLLLKI